MTDEAARDGSALSEGLGLAPERNLVVRLRARRTLMSIDDMRWYMTATPDSDCEEASAEIERLRAAVAAEREPSTVVFRALLLAAWDAPGTRTAGEMRAAAVTLFGEAAIDAALARIRAEHQRNAPNEPRGKNTKYPIR